MKNFINKLSDKQDYYAVIMLWLVFQAIWIAVFGFDFQGESDKYITEARLFIINHGFTQQRYIFYSTTILIIVCSNLIKMGVYGAVAIIMLINLCSYLYFFKAIKSFYVEKYPAYLLLIFLLFFWPYQRWSITLYTEGIFYSLVLVLFALLIRYRDLSARFLLALSAVMTLLVLTRPMGVLFIVPVLMFIYFHLVGRQKVIFLIGLIVGLVLINQVAQVVFTTTRDWSMVQALQSDIIIADKEVIPVNKNIVITQNPNQLYQLVFYITHNFSHFIMLALKRLQAFFFLVRSYYSTAHNVFLLAPVALVYLLIISRVNKIKKAINKSLLVFVVLSVVFFAVAVALQFDDYHNRFFLTLMPCITVLASAAVFQIKSSEM
ncbi:hypothetical protein LK994_10230 [Ferruginibacter lapsinanis]|uniref:hypothetical protein n=1 Tax=Ferruginibacter lapsinanis TaxID=563172 RepID=UPI001E45FF16|nr:hypothetical protein [Ferruginibacter lapsinanis]UEG49013.1 hypothetical protein LK994_10230 [Ferruginibacter lapsinanis]